MRFDPEAAKRLTAGSHLIIENCPGLRLAASASRRTWTYRYKSPVDGRMRQIKIGAYPTMSLAAAMAEWQKLRSERTTGIDLAIEKRTAKRPDAYKRRRTIWLDDAHWSVLKQLGDEWLIRALDLAQDASRLMRGDRHAI
jgi:hypothetical protein